MRIIARPIQYKFGKKPEKRRVPKWLRVVLFAFGGLVTAFALANVVMFALYRNKVLPNYSVAAVPIGNTAFAQLDKKVSVEDILPDKVTFVKDGKTKAIAPKDLGVTVDWATTQEHIRRSHSWLPLVSLFVKKSVPAELQLDNDAFAAATKDLSASFHKSALPEHIAFQNDAFVIAAPEPGYELDAVALRLGLINTLEKGKTQVQVPTTATNASESTGTLQDKLSELQKQLESKITLIHGTNKKQLSRADIAAFYEPDGQTLKLSSTKMREVIAGVVSGFDITAVNQDEAVTAATYALLKHQPVDFMLASQGVKIYHYCTAARGLDNSVLTEYRHKLAAVYGDPHGWAHDGRFALVYSETGCDFTAWLSAAAQMTSFSASICDSTWSCRVGPNVVVNYDRWMGASDSWNAAGGTLEDYRIMVINHETGHWLGFGHRNCTGAGQPAPLMQQQSIDLEGCTFNPWPTAAELAVL